MKVAFVFPGQGSQAVGMLDAFGGEPAVKSVLARAGEALGEDLGQLIAGGPAEQLNLTVNTQPAMLAAGVAIYRAWLAAGGAVPSILAGHSLGEYTALTVAEAIPLDVAVRLVRFRAQAMQDAVPAGSGAMAAILGLTDDQVAQACAEAAQGEVVEAVNFNDTVQTVIAGHKGAVERAMVACKARGAKRAVHLPVSAPFHSSLIRPAADKLAARLADLTLNAPVIPVINNVDVAVESDPARIKEALVRQAYNPVRWVETIQKMGSMGVAMVAECGPGKVLSKLTKRCVHEMEGIALADEASIDSHLNLE